MHVLHHYKVQNKFIYNIMINIKRMTHSISHDLTQIKQVKLSILIFIFGGEVGGTVLKAFIS